MNTKKILFELVVLTLFFSIFTDFTPSAQETSSASVWIKIHRIEAIDRIETGIEGDEADWRYHIYLWHGRIWEEDLWDAVEYRCEPNHNDIKIDNVHQFDNVAMMTITTVIIDLLEDDPPYYATADISSSIPQEGPGTSISGKRFRIRYDLTSNTIVEGDKAVFENGYYRTSGEFDDRTAPDECDANLWFLIWDNIGLNAYFTHTPADPTVRHTVQFTDVSPDPEGRLSSWLWDFGDGCTSNDKNPAHKYDKAGDYTVTLVVADDEGVKGEMSQTVAISGASLNPMLWFVSAFILIAVAIVGTIGALFVKRRKSRS